MDCAWIAADPPAPFAPQALPRGVSRLPSLTHLSLTLNGAAGRGRTLGLRGLEGSLETLAVAGSGLYIMPQDLAACSRLTSLQLAYTGGCGAGRAGGQGGRAAGRRQEGSPLGALGIPSQKTQTSA